MRGFGILIGVLLVGCASTPPAWYGRETTLVHYLWDLNQYAKFVGEDCVGHVQAVKQTLDPRFAVREVYSCADRALRAQDVCHVSAEVRHKASGRVWVLDNGAVMDDPDGLDMFAFHLGSEPYYYDRTRIAEYALARNARERGRGW